MTRPILVFGAGGQVGQELLALAARRGEAVRGVGRDEADIADAAIAAEEFDTEKLLIRAHQTLPFLGIGTATVTIQRNPDGLASSAGR